MGSLLLTALLRLRRGAAGERTAQAEDTKVCVSESVADYRHSTLPHLQPQSSLKSKTYNKTQSRLGWVSSRALQCGPGIWKATEPPQYGKPTKSSYPFEQSIPPGNFTQQPSVPVRKGGEKPRARGLRCGLPNGRQGRAAAPILTDGRHSHRTCVAPKIMLVKTTQNGIHADDSGTRPEMEPSKIVTPSAAMDRNQEQWLATNTSKCGRPDPYSTERGHQQCRSWWLWSLG